MSTSRLPRARSSASAVGAVDAHEQQAECGLKAAQEPDECRIDRSDAGDEDAPCRAGQGQRDIESPDDPGQP